MPNLGLIFLAAIVLLPLGYYLYDWMQRRRMLLRLKAAWGQEEALRRTDQEELKDIAQYYEALREQQPPAKEVDYTTWGDLDMDLVFRGMDASVSSLGSEVLYAMLHEQGTPEGVLRERTQLADALLEDEQMRLQVQTALHGIGRSAFHGACRYLFSAAFQMPPHAWVYPILSPLPLVLAVLGIVSPVFLFGSAGAFLINLLVYYRMQAAWQKEVIAIRHIGSVLRTARLLGKVKQPGFQRQAQKLEPLNSAMLPIRFWLPLFGMESYGDMAIVLEYIRILFLPDMLSLVAIIRHINKHNEALRAIYSLVGEVDACLSIAQLRLRRQDLCQPVFHQERRLEAQALCHPLVRNAVANDLHWQRDVLISGSNASGKSTFIKAVAINIILAQSIHLGFAEKLALCRGKVMSAMAVRDNILAGESYFVVEIKSMRRILQASQQEMIYCFIDEILRGTNTIERIAASSAVLRQLAEQQALCMAATHDIELTRMLADCYEMLHFAEVVEGGNLTFDYLIKQGPTKTRNAIRLLSEMGYPKPVIDRALHQISAYEQLGTWSVAHDGQTD